MKNFEYHHPRSLNESISLLMHYGDKAKVLAGGTDLLVRMKREELFVPHLINLKKIPELNFIRYDHEAGLSIGSATVLSTLASSRMLSDKYPLLVESIKTIASPQIQNMATIGGNLCNASPAADMASPLIALRAEIKIAGTWGEKFLALEEFFVGPGKTILKTGDILVEIRIPKVTDSTKAVYLKHGVRKAMEIAIVCVSVALDIDPKSYICNQARIVMGAVAPTPIRSPGAESILIGHKIDENLKKAAAEAAANDACPISDVRGSKSYRLEILKFLVQKGISEILHSVRQDT